MDGAGGSAAAAWDEVQAEFAAVDAALSRFRDDSELTALNRAAGTGRAVRVSWRLRETIALMDRARRMTGGRFDATLAEALERIGERGARLDPVESIHAGPAPAAGSATQGRDLERPRPVAAPGRPLDSGGIGKGLALRWAARRAMAVLPERAGVLLEAGGDVVAAGSPPPGGWLVGIEDPLAGADPDAEPVAVVALSAGAVATSSVRVRHWTAPDGSLVHHLLDPRTGEPVRTGLIAVSVAMADPAWAEVWTKALFLAGRSGIGDEARARGLAAWWVTNEGRVGLTPAARERSTWVAEARVG